MRLLAVADALVLERAVASEVRHRRERVPVDPLDNGPAGEDDRRQRPDPVESDAGDPAAEGHLVRVTVEADVDPLQVPELVEDRVEVEVDADRCAAEDSLVAEHPGDVQQHVWNGTAVAPEEGARTEAQALEVAGRLARWFRGVHDPYLVAELLQAVDVLEDSRGRAALVRIRGDHSGDEDPHATSSSSAPSTRSELNSSSAS